MTLDSADSCGYTEKPYPTSQSPPLGLTFKGKAKSYLDAHEKLRDKICKGKGKVFTTNGIKWKVLDVKTLQNNVDAVIEVETKGNVNLKVYGINKKKSATIELRKSPGFEYNAVEALQKIIKDMLNKFTDTESTEEVTKSLVTSKPKLFKCHVCKWESKFSYDLRTHMKELHPEISEINCQICEKNFSNKDELEVHLKSHECAYCQLIFKTDVEVANHIKCFHKTEKKRFNTSPLCSPPSKKLNNDGYNKANTIEADIENIEDLMEIEFEASEAVERLKELHVQELEAKIIALEKELELEKLKGSKLDDDTEVLNNYGRKIRLLTQNVSKVHKDHIPYLRGYELSYKAKGDGACLVNAASLHLYGSEEKSKNLRRTINTHLVANLDYYSDKIGLPFKETVGVGKEAKTVSCTTRNEMIAFLLSDDALYVYRRYHDLLALANIFNINISVFTYKNTSEGNWNFIEPDRVMVSKDVKNMGKCIEDMALYNSDEYHFDVLIKNDNLLAMLNYQKETIALQQNIEETSKKDEVLLMDIEPCDVSKDLSEEIILLQKSENVLQKSQEQPEKSFKCNDCEQKFQSERIMKVHINENHNPTRLYECEKCKKQFKSERIMEAHMSENHNSSAIYTCENCEKVFQTQNDLILHKETHNSQWNCEDCFFQGHFAEDLMNHLKVSSHQPSKSLDKRKIFKDYRQCYTCHLEFDGYLNLMNHRKQVNPSNKKCRNFPVSCKHGSLCWYVHDESKSSDGSENENCFKCSKCDDTFKERNEFMIHNKLRHAEYVLSCEKFKKGECSRNENSCWFMHGNNSNEPSNVSQSNQVFHKVRKDSAPPDQVTEILQLVALMKEKMEAMEVNIQALQKQDILPEMMTI